MVPYPDLFPCCRGLGAHSISGAGAGAFFPVAGGLGGIYVRDMGMVRVLKYGAVMGSSFLRRWPTKFRLPFFSLQVEVKLFLGVEGMAAEEVKKRVAVEILGERYIVRSSSTAEHMLEVGKYVNRLMTEVVDKYPYMSTHKVAILTALNIASDLLLARKQGKRKKR